jgi:hypothetical protein
MAHLRIEARPDGALLLTHTGGPRWGTALVGIGLGVVVLASVAAGEVTILGGVVAVPLGLITLLAGVGAARHRDWIVFDRRAREIVFRRGLAAMFRPVRTVPFDEVEAIVVVEPAAAGDPVVVALRRTEAVAWPIDASPDAAYVRRLVAALREVGGWPVHQEREEARP